MADLFPEDDPDIVELGFFSFASTGDVAGMQQLLKRERDGARLVNVADYDKRTPLHLASEEGRLEAVKLLVESGANVNAVDNFGNTPLAGALSRDQQEVATYLMSKGADLSEPIDLKAGLAAVADERDLPSCKAVFESVDKSVAAVGSVSRVVFERFLVRKYGIDVHNHHVAQRELDEVTRNSREPATTAAHLRASSSGAVEGEEADLSLAPLTWSGLVSVIKRCDSVIGRALKNKLVVRDWSAFVRKVKTIVDEVLAEISSSTGQTAWYIPELGLVDPNVFAVSITTVDGQTLSIGAASEQFPMQSCMTPVLYTINLAELGLSRVHEFIGREPSGSSYNAYQLNKLQKPHNACVNAGAITNCALYHVDEAVSTRYKRFASELKKLAGGLEPNFSHAVYLSEKANAWTNQGLAYFMKSKGAFPPKSDFLDALDFFHQLCSIEVTTELLASVAAMYANAGVNPLSNERCFTEDQVKDTMQLMYSCGLFSYSGEWACAVGIPATSGVCGAIWFVVPHRVGVCVRAPPLDRHGNSVRGIEFCKRLGRRMNWALLDVIAKKTAN